MHILITGASTPLAQAIAAALSSDHQLRLLDTTPPDPLPSNAEFIQGNYADPPTAWQAVRHTEALIHTAYPSYPLPDTSPQREEYLLDQATHGTHVLCQAAVDAGVKRILYASTLEIFSSYPDTVYISELYKPQPPPEIHQMTRYLGELTCREFARDHMITATALRLGKLVREEDVAGQPPDPMWLDPRDAAQAFRLVLDRDQSNDPQWKSRWALYHICAAIDNPKYLIGQATRIGYQPQHNFQRNNTS